MVHCILLCDASSMSIFFFFFFCYCSQTSLISFIFCNILKPRPINASMAKAFSTNNVRFINMASTHIRHTKESEMCKNSKCKQINKLSETCATFFKRSNISHYYWYYLNFTILIRLIVEFYGIIFFRYAVFIFHSLAEKYYLNTVS